MMGVFAILTLSVWGGSTGLRWYLNRSSRRPTELAGGKVQFTTLWNRKGAFDAPVQARKMAVLSLLLLPLTLLWRTSSPVGAGLILGGGLSNLWERLRFGAVYDYLKFPKAPRPWRRYVYNLADLAIFGGVVLVVLRMLFPKKRCGFRSIRD